MNLRLLFCIGMGCFTTCLGIVMLVNALRPPPQRARPSQPNFSAREATVVDAETGEKATYREITVTTKLAPGPAGPSLER